eukprot:CAMPEP_0116853632 /NCGR_PEP_ID=MMETSP0418-20121206/18039_1 /TAXON_ID=1158023 /ORGANISM="Astrosyne radiata, Strain 13vi08-1A" /LENGTH=275 /DNA_ID=CAMNT_0004486093 /DNA_START=17 /DNA_END=845 /DNA_ORIENTATION=+
MEAGEEEAMCSHQDGDDTSHGEEDNPLVWIGCGDDGNDDVASLWEERHTTCQRQTARRNWGIPTFSDQVDRGIQTFVLSHLEHKDLYVTIHLEHRKDGTASDIDHNWEKILPRATQSVLELGAGTGVVGLYCAKCLNIPRVALTDLHLSLLQRNRSANQLDLVSIFALDWTADAVPPEIHEDGYDVIVGSDLFLPFASFLLEPLARTLSRLLSLRKGSVAVLVYEERFDCSKFFVIVGALGLDVVFVDNSLLHPTYQDPGRIHVLKITKPRGENN